jgi:hypothetical protein
MTMRKTIALIGTLMVLGQPAAALAQGTVQGSVHTQTTVKATNPVKEVALLPARVVTGAVNTPIGLVNGMGKRAGQAVNWVNERTLRQVDFNSDPGKSFVMVPVGVVGNAAALGLGAGVGAVEGSFRGFARGFAFDSDR